MPHPFAAQQSLFRAYDIRGAEHYFSAKFVHALGAAFVRLFKAQNHNKLNGQTSVTPKTPTVIIGYDVRHGSADIAKLLATILQQQGLQVISLGLITTPMMAFWSEQYDGHGIMVTASHSAKGILGIKWLVNNASPSAKSIQQLYQDLTSTPLSANNKINPLINNTLSNSDVAVINLPTSAVAAPYIQAIEEVFTAIYPKHNLSAINNRRVIKKLELTVVIDCLNGATSRIAEPLFSQFCQRVIILNDSPDGSFPTGNPDPTEPNRLAELQQTVIVHSADIGLAFDGDGDRLMIVDNSGKVVTADHLLYLLAKVAITEHPNSLGHSSSLDNCSLDRCSSLTRSDNENKSKSVAKSDDQDGLLSPPQVLFDIKCSHHLPLLLRELGALPVLSKTGSSMMRRQLRAQESYAIFAGELSGHFIFNDGYFTVYDDAMYAGLRLLNWLAYTATAPVDSNTRTSSVNLWGEQVSASAPYQLTDITKDLPLLVSTADHYIPLADSASDNGSESCSVITHLTEFCHYLQGLVAEYQPDKFQASTNGLFSSNLTAMDKLNSCCDCLDISHYMTSEQAQSLLPVGTKLSSIDGVRLDFTHGFGVVRQSNTSNALTVRFAGDSLDDLKDVQARFVALCNAFDQGLAEKVAAIRAE